MRVLVLAYACSPDVGSEPGAGWAWLKAAATNHEATVLTASDFSEGIEDALLRSGLKASVVRLRTNTLARLVSEPAGRLQYIHYLDWWFIARKWIILNQHNFDVVHHVTYASDWLPSPAQAASIPFVWGPVGGGTYPPVSCLTFLSTSARLKELARAIVTVPCRLLLTRATAQRSAIALALNADSAARIRQIGAARVEIRPNCALDPNVFGHRRGTRNANILVMIGRIHEFKGFEIALRALSLLPSRFRLHVFGDGPDRRRLEARVQKLGLAERVVLFGRRPQSEIAEALMTSGALVFPSLHDSSPWTVAEAVSVGVPIVHMSHGGSGSIAGLSGTAVRADRMAAENFASALLAAVERKTDPNSRWMEPALVEYLDRIYGEVAVK